MNLWRRDLTKLAEAHGALVVMTKGQHYRIQHPDGWFVFAPATPSDRRRVFANVRSQVRRQATNTRTRRR